MAASDPVLEVNLGDNGGLQRFRTYDEVEKFLVCERSYYAWLNNAVRNDPIGRNFASSIDSIFSRALNDFQQLRQSNRPISQYGDLIIDIFVRNNLPLSTSATAKFIDNLRNEEGDLVAVGALALLTNQLRAINASTGPTRETARGSFLACAFLSGLNAKSVLAHEEALIALSNKFSSALLETEARHRRTFAMHEEETRIAKRNARRFMLEHARKFKRYRIAVNDEFRERVEEFRKVQVTYEELMKIKAPVDYWKSKAAEHRKQALIYRNDAYSFARIGGGALIIALAILSVIVFFLAQNDKNTASLLLFTIGAVISTITFWIARVLVRLFMSEHHLAVDADERATMAMTYLALTEKGVADEKDRQIVLAALFRTTQDGIVKDDGAPDISPAAILSRSLSR